MAFELKAFYSKIYRTYDLVNRLFTLGMDKRWRKVTARRCLEKNPAAVMDLCCGTGDLSMDLIKWAKNEQLKVTGYDFNPDMLSIARIKSENKNLKNTEFIEGDAAQMPFKDGRFDAITIGFGFRNLTFENPARDKHIEEMHRVLKEQGELLILESGVPSNLIVRFFYKLYLYLFLIPLGGLISWNFKAYWYLAHSSSKFYSIVEVKDLLLSKQFSNVESRKFFFGAANLVIATK